MSFIHRQKGRPYWYITYFDQDGTRRKRSSKTTDKRNAQRMAAALYKSVQEAKYGTFTRHRARLIIEELIGEVADKAGSPLERQTARQYFDTWLDGKTASPGTMTRYRGIVAAFLKFLHAKADGPLHGISDSDVQKFRELLKKDVAAGTVNCYLKVIRVALNRAVKKGVLDRNPAGGVDNLDPSEKHQRRPFTVDEFKRLFEAAGPNWRTMLANGLYTGLRLSDCANLTAANLDLVSGHYVMQEKKTKRTRTIPIAKPLHEYLLALELGDNPQAPLCPELHGKPETWLSNEFYDLMSSIGMVPARDHLSLNALVQKRKDLAETQEGDPDRKKKMARLDAQIASTKSKGKGRGSRRTQSEITFHSLRYTATSLLKNAGVSDIVARDIIGHQSEAVSRNYTVIEESTKRAALDKLPEILQAPDRRQPELPI